MSEFRLLLIVGLVLCGCAPAEPPPPMPKPIEIEVPSNATPTSPGENPREAAVLDGTWTHTLPGENDVERRVILKYIKDQDGPARFEIVQHDWPEKPVFTETITNGEQTELWFKMVSPQQETETTTRTLRYLLHKENGNWVGTLTESWNPTPIAVVLTKSDA